LGLLDLEPGNLVGGLGCSFDAPFIPFVQLFLLVADNCIAFRDFVLEGRDGGVVIASGSAEGSDLSLQEGSVPNHVPQVEHPAFRMLADVRDQVCRGVGVRRRFGAGSHRVGDGRLMG
jgi:hypothetical protein